VFLEAMGHGFEGCAVAGGGKDGEAAKGLVEEFLGLASGGAMTAVRDDFCDDLAFAGGVFAEKKLGQFFQIIALELLEEMEGREGEFALGEIGAKGFAAAVFLAEKIDAIIIDLVGEAHVAAIGAKGFDGGFGGVINESGSLGGDAEECGGLHLDDLHVFGDGEFQVEASLCLEDFSGAKFLCGVGDFSAEVGLRQAGAELQRVCEKGIPEKNGEFVTPLGVQGQAGAAEEGAIEDVVVDEGGEVDEFDDDGEVVVGFLSTTGGFGGEEAEGGTEALALALDGVGYVPTDAGVKGIGLDQDATLHTGEAGLDLLEIGAQVELGKGDGGFSF